MVVLQGIGSQPPQPWPAPAIWSLSHNGHDGVDMKGGQEAIPYRWRIRWSQRGGYDDMTGSVMAGTATVCNRFTNVMPTNV